MNIEKAHDIHQAIKLHFTQEKYDAFRYNFKTRMKLYDNQRYLYEKFRSYTENDYKIFILANALNSIYTIRMMKKDYFLEYQNKMDSISYHVASQLKKLVLEENTSFHECCTKNIFYREYKHGNLSFETICILNLFTNFLTDQGKETFKMRKYTPFLKEQIPQEKMKKAIMKIFN